jgi:hypothetical protein
MSNKKERIGKLIYRLECGNDIQNRDLKSVLTDDEFKQYEAEWENHLDWKSGVNYEYSSKYDDLLKKGDFANNKAESGRFGKEATKKLYREAENYYERALEALQEESQMNPMIGASYDRSYDTLSSNTDISYHGMPRRLTSKSLQNQGNVVYSSSGGSTTTKEKVTKRDFKLKALKESLDNFERRGNESSEDEAIAERMKTMLANLKNRK